MAEILSALIASTVRAGMPFLGSFLASGPKYPTPMDDEEWFLTVEILEEIYDGLKMTEEGAEPDWECEGLPRHVDDFNDDHSDPSERVGNLVVELIMVQNCSEMNHRLGFNAAKTIFKLKYRKTLVIPFDMWDAYVLRWRPIYPASPEISDEWFPNGRELAVEMFDPYLVEWDPSSSSW